MDKRVVHSFKWLQLRNIRNISNINIHILMGDDPANYAYYRQILKYILLQ